MFFFGGGREGKQGVRELFVSAAAAAGISGWGPEQHPLPAARLVEFRSLFLPLRIARTAAH